MNMLVEINKAEITTCEWLLGMFANPQIWSPYMIEGVIREYKKRLQQENEKLINPDSDKDV